MIALALAHMLSHTRMGMPTSSNLHTVHVVLPIGHGKGRSGVHVNETSSAHSLSLPSLPRAQFIGYGHVYVFFSFSFCTKTVLFCEIIHFLAVQ